ncbi:MAG: BON domain-containing protein [Gammaproteobacteria bacterium]|nr:BON domain-containing protein [Gammaproteobacteria bacterium]
MFNIRSVISFTLLSALAINLTGCPVPLLVAGGAAATMGSATERRDAQALIDDQSIEMQISNAIHSDPALDTQAHINIVSYNRTVLLTGEAPTEELLTRAVDLARRVEGVKVVHNEILNAAPSSLASRSKDSWITTKIKSGLFAAQDISAQHFKIVTENQSVFLMGLVTHAEADIAVEITRQVEDVQQVITLFEYQN